MKIRIIKKSEVVRSFWGKWSTLIEQVRTALDELEHDECIAVEFNDPDERHRAAAAVQSWFYRRNEPAPKTSTSGNTAPYMLYFTRK